MNVKNINEIAGGGLEKLSEGHEMLKRNVGDEKESLKIRRAEGYNPYQIWCTY